MDDHQREPDGLSPEELEAETAEALPERAAMSTLSPSGIDPVSGTTEAVGDTVGETTGTVGDTAGGVVAGTGDTVGDVVDSLGDQSLLDLDVDLDADLDAAAPISAAVAANANVAAPIDAAVSANTLSPDATSLASADQD